MASSVWIFVQGRHVEDGRLILRARRKSAVTADGAEFIVRSHDGSWSSAPVALVDGATIPIPRDAGNVQLDVFDFFGRTCSPTLHFPPGGARKNTQAAGRNRFWISAVLAAVLAIGAPSVFFMLKRAKIEPPKTVFVAALGANLRQGPNLQSQSLILLKRGARLTVGGSSPDGLLTEVNWNNQIRGWMANTVLLNEMDMKRLAVLSASDYVQLPETARRLRAAEAAIETAPTRYTPLVSLVGQRRPEARRMLLRSPLSNTMEDDAAARWYAYGSRAEGLSKLEVYSVLQAASAAAPLREDILIRYGDSCWETTALSELARVTKSLLVIAPANAMTWKLIGLEQSTLSDQNAETEARATGAFILALRLAASPATLRKELLSIAAKAPATATARLIPAALAEERTQPRLFVTQ